MNLNLSQFFFLIFCLSVTNCIFDDIKTFTDLPTFPHFQEFVSSKDNTICVYIYNSLDCQQCEQANPIIEQFSEDMDGIIQFGLLDCDTLWEDKNSRAFLDICHPKNTTALPQLLFFEPHQNRFSEDRKTENAPKQHMYQGPVQLSSLVQFAKTIIPSFRTLINDEEQLKDFLSFTAIPNKVILFTNKQETPVLFRGLTSYFREKIEFGEIRKQSKQLIKKYKITSFPTLLILKLETTGNYQQIPYKGLIRFEIIKQELEQYALQRRLIKPKDRSIIREDEEPEFYEINSNDVQKTIEENENYVFLYLFKEKDEEMKKKLIEKFEHLFDYYEMNCNEDENIKYVEKQFKVRSFPKLIYFPNEIIKNKFSKKIIFNKEDTIETIMSDIVQNFREPLATLSDQNVQPFILQTMENQQTPVILTVKDKNWEELFFYTAYANQQKWNDRLVFGVSINPTKLFRKLLNIKKIPSLLSVLGKNEQNENDHQVAHFSGNWDSRAVRGFISDIYSRSLVKLPNEQKVIEITNQENMDKKCSGKNQYCFIGFFEGHDRFIKRHGDKKLNSYLNILYQMETEFGSKKFSFNWIDGQCFLDVLSRLYIQNPLEEMPIFIAYNQESMKYAYFTKEFNEYNIRNFIKEVQEGKTQWIRPKEELDIDEKNCKKFHESYVPIVKPRKKKSKREDL